jgi:hypothetical protein
VFLKFLLALDDEATIEDETETNLTALQCTHNMKSVVQPVDEDYIPQLKLRMIEAQTTHKSSVEFQRLAWEDLKKSIHGLINQINVSNIPDSIISLIKENIIRGRGLLATYVILAQSASPTFTRVYAALVAIINAEVICF